MHWLHVHPRYLIDAETRSALRLAALWRDGVLPEPGGVLEQAAATVASIEIVLGAWSKMQAERLKRLKRLKD